MLLTVAATTAAAATTADTADVHNDRLVAIAPLLLRRMQHAIDIAATISHNMVNLLLLLLLITGDSTLLQLIAVIAIAALVGMSRIS